jgi:uncharacterized protein YyaL (SSP411 family)
VQDNAIPSGNALAARALLHLYAFSGEEKYLKAIQNSWAQIANAVSRYPTAFGEWLCAMDYAVHPPKEIALIFDQKGNLLPYLQEIHSSFQPYLVVAASSYPVNESQMPPLLHARELLDERTTAYVCQGFVCQQPVTSLLDFRQQISS